MDGADLQFSSRGSFFALEVHFSNSVGSGDSHLHFRRDINFPKMCLILSYELVDEKVN